MSGQQAVIRAESGVRSKRSPEVMRLLRSTLTPTLLGDRIPMDFYARCGFRLLGVSASVSQQELAKRCQQFRNRVRLDAAQARHQAIHTIRDEHLDVEALTSAVAKLESPRHRFLAELFWPHAREADFDSIRRAGRLGSPGLIQLFNLNGEVGLARAHRVHILALTHHCMAIESECEFLEGGPAPSGKHWESAIQNWRELCGNEVFWHYLTGRTESLDDPRLRKEDVASAREDLPRVVLGLQETLAEKYANSGNYEECARHLNLITQSGFSDAIVQAATGNAVKRVAGTQLDGLFQRLYETIQKLPDAVNRDQLELVLGPLLAEAKGIRELLANRLHLSESLLAQPAFDTLAEALLAAAEKKLKYNSDERERNLVYRALFAKRLMQLPLSPAARRKMEQAIQEIDRLLYAHFGIDQAPKALECFFLPGSETSPDQSIIINLYRITKREVTVDRVQRTGGIRVFTETFRVLIPRSADAKPAHGGQAEVRIPASEYTVRQKAAAEEIKAIESKRQALQADLRARCDSEMQTATSAMHADIEQKFGARMKQLEVAVASASQQERAALEAEAKAGDDTKKHIDAAHAPSLRAMRERQERARRGFAGPVGIVKIELPAAVLLFFVFLRIPGGTIVALICSILLGQWIRFLVRFSNARPQRAYDSAVASSEREQEARERAIQDRFAKARREQQSTLDSLSRERSKAIETINRKIAALRKPWDDQIVKVAAVHQEQAGPFRAQLVRKIKVKSESQKKEFPAYVAALCKGFKEGSGPSQSEMEMTTSEVSQARAMLRLY